MARISITVLLSLLALAYWYGQLVEGSITSRRYSIRKPAMTKIKDIDKFIAKKLEILTRRIKPPTFITTVSKKVCARSFSSTDLKRVSALKTSLNSKTKPLTCQKRFPFKFPSKINLERARRSAGNCNPRSMKDYEIQARADLAPMGININHICLKRYDCAEPGSLDSSTGTLNMCNSCKYIVYLPVGYFPRYILHFKCGDGGDLNCLLGEGACIKRQLNHQLSYILGRSAQITVTTGCACKILQNSIFTAFI